MTSSELKGYLAGLIVGDAYIDKGITKRGLVIKSVCKQFIDKVQHDISSCTQFTTYVRQHDACFCGGCHHKEYWEFIVKAHPYFAKKYHHFYTDSGSRWVSREVTQWMTAAGIANWFMGDGYTCLVGKSKGIIKSRRIQFCTDRYDMKSIERLQKMLENKFGIKTSVIKRNNRYRINILIESFDSFLTLVYPHLVPDMYYKIYLAYEKQPIWMSNENWEIQQSIRSAITLTDNAA